MNWDDHKEDYKASEEYRKQQDAWARKESFQHNSRREYWPMRLANFEPALTSEEADWRLRQMLPRRRNS